MFVSLLRTKQNKKKNRMRKQKLFFICILILSLLLVLSCHDSLVATYWQNEFSVKAQDPITGPSVLAALQQKQQKNRKRKLDQSEVRYHQLGCPFTCCVIEGTPIIWVLKVAPTVHRGNICHFNLIQRDHLYFLFISVVWTLITSAPGGGGHLSLSFIFEGTCTKITFVL